LEMAGLMPAAILVLNARSSSLKATLFQLPHQPLPVTPIQPLWNAHVSWGNSRPKELTGPLLRTLWEGSQAVIAGPHEIAAIGHRIVHGGRKFRDPARITPALRSELAGLSEIAPEHNCLAAAIIEQTDAIFGGRTPQFAVFDTAFHATLPERALVYGGPYEWLNMGIRRYGFHGLSHRYMVRRAAEMLGRSTAEVNLITCHLGNGCSLAAIRGGASVDTTMGYTPLEGLMMGSRSGSLDPAILIHLQRKHGMSAEELYRILNEEAGLKGVSGLSSDMRDIEKAKAGGNSRAALAFDCFVQQLCREIGAMLASTGPPDAIVFAGGIGEHSFEVRQAACDRFAAWGVKVEPEKNRHAKPDADISAADATTRVLIVQAQEDWEIAQEVQRMLAGLAGESGG
jgi:acetate kinase